MQSATSGAGGGGGGRFGRGVRFLRMELSARLRPEERRALAEWIRRLPAGFAERLPRLKLAAAEQMRLAKARVVIDEKPLGEMPQGLIARPEDHLHAASFIPQRTVVLHRGLFRRRVELGRILYHELCHFLWPRLGNPLRWSYEELVWAEFGKGVRGELGYSSEWRKEKLRAEGGRVSGQKRLWREYVCESFCDTAAYVLLGSERRAGHSEYTLSRAARERRERWMEKLGIGSGEQGSKQYGRRARPFSELLYRPPKPGRAGTKQDG